MKRYSVGWMGEALANCDCLLEFMLMFRGNCALSQWASDINGSWQKTSEFDWPNKNNFCSVISDAIINKMDSYFLSFSVFGLRNVNDTSDDINTTRTKHVSRCQLVNLSKSNAHSINILVSFTRSLARLLCSHFTCKINWIFRLMLFVKTCKFVCDDSITLFLYIPTNKKNDSLFNGTIFNGRLSFRQPVNHEWLLNLCSFDSRSLYCHSEAKLHVGITPCFNVQITSFNILMNFVFCNTAKSQQSSFKKILSSLKKSWAYAKKNVRFTCEPLSSSVAVKKPLFSEIRNSTTAFQSISIECSLRMWHK